MIRVKRSAIVPFTCEQMFALVNDVESYPQFMPGCVKTELIGKGEDWLEARLHIVKSGIKQSFSTHNSIDPPNKMTIALLEGPFKHFNGVWLFTELAESACKLELQLEFEFSNRILGMAVGRVFESVASEQVDAICTRAKYLYEQ